MTSKSRLLATSQTLCTLTCLLYISKPTSAQKPGIHRDSSGVILDPFILSDPIPDDWTCNQNHVEVMIDLISSRFSRVSNYWLMTDPMGSTPHCNSLIPTVTANVNRKNNTEKLQVMLYSGHSADVNQTIRDVKYVWESATVANKLYPETVSSIVLYLFKSLNDTETHSNAITVLQKYKELNRNQGKPIQIGINLYNSECGEQSDKLPPNLEQVLGLIDVVIYQVDPTNDQYNKLTPEQVADEITAVFTRCKRKIQQKFGNRVTVHLRTSWHYIGKNENYKSAATLNNRVEYWGQISSRAEKDNTLVLWESAFDRPHTSDSRRQNIGWWELRATDKNITKKAFHEKILDAKNYKDASGENPRAFQDTPSMSPLAISLSAVAGLILLLSIALVVFLWQKNKRLQSQGLTQKDINEFLNGNASGIVESSDVKLDVDMLRLPYNTKLELAKNSFTIDHSQVLGTGAFGSVYRGTIDGIQNDFAFKVASSSSCAVMLKSLLSEIKVMSFLGNHEYIVNLIGAYTAELRDGIVYVVTDLCEGGSLEKYLRRQQDADEETDYEIEVITTTHQFQGQYDTLRWSYQIACGMEYIASKNVVHADLATRNVLLTYNMIAKISDFGLSRRLYNYTNYVKKNQEPLPWRWMALESLNNLEFTEKSDVWAFGVTMWEIYSLGKTPYPGLAWSPDFMKELERGLRLPRPSLVSEEIYDLMSKCWLRKASDRLSFADLREALMNHLGEHQQNFYVDVK